MLLQFFVVDLFFERKVHHIYLDLGAVDCHLWDLTQQISQVFGDAVVFLYHLRHCLKRLEASPTNDPHLSHAPSKTLAQTHTVLNRLGITQNDRTKGATHPFAETECHGVKVATNLLGADSIMRNRIQDPGSITVDLHIFLFAEHPQVFQILERPHFAIERGVLNHDKICGREGQMVALLPHSLPDLVQL